MPNVRPGQLAMVVGSYAPANNGAIVRVVEAAPPQENGYVSFAGLFWGVRDASPIWIVESVSRPLIYAAHSPFERVVSAAVCHDSSLMPLTPPEDTPAQDEEYLAPELTIPEEPVTNPG